MNCSYNIQEARDDFHRYITCPIHYLHEIVRHTKLHTAMKDIKNGYALVNKYIRDGVEPNIKNKKGETALHRAITYGQEARVIRALLQSNADVNIPNSFGNSPLHLALIYRYDINIIKELCTAGASLTSVNKNGDTPLLLAINNKLCNAHVIKYLLKQDLEIDARNRKGRTALVEAVFRLKDTSVIKALLEHGADVNMLDARGYSALHYAISYNCINTARLLFKYGANPCFQNLKCCFADEDSVFLLIQYLTLQHFELHKMSPLRNLVWDKVMIDLKQSAFFSFDKLKEMYNSCFLELESMRSDFLYNDFTMYDFVLNRLFVNRFSCLEPDHIVEGIVSRLSAGRYRNYLNLIFVNLNKSELLSCLSNQFILHTSHSCNSLYTSSCCISSWVELLF